MMLVSMVDSWSIFRTNGAIFSLAKRATEKQVKQNAVNRCYVQT